MTTPATTWRETVPEGEAATFERYAEQLRELQRAKAKKAGGVMRGLHAKGQVGLEAELTVLPGLPEHARIGLFATPKTFRAFVRVSNGAGERQSDTRPDVRGLAVKVVGVDGRKLIPGMEDAKTQDFLAIRTPAIPFSNADDFLWLVFAAATPALLVPKLLLRFGPLRGIRLLRKLLAGMSAPMVSVATTAYYSALPIQFGPYAVHYAFVPHAKEGPGAKQGTTPEHVAEELAARLAKGAVVYDLRLQFFRDDQATPIEDASVEWKEADAPFVTVARLTLAQQDVATPRAKAVAAFVEKLSFDPWHALVELRPLGNMMRARNAAYRHSTQERGAAPEPDGTERFG